MLRAFGTVLVAGALLAAGCGGSDGGSSTSAAPAPRGPEDARLRAQLRDATSVAPGTFPATQGRTLQEVADTITATGPQLAFASSVLTTGEHERLAFGLLDEDRFLYAPTAIYLAKSGGRARALGPYPAPADLLVTDAPFRSETAASEESPFAAVYATTVPFAEPGTYDVLAVSKVQGQDVAAGGQVKVVTTAQDRIPDVGEPAPAVATDTVQSAGGDVESIDTRRPVGTMHDASFDDVLGKKPALLLFATPQLCQSRVCGPVVDIAEQLKRTYGERVQFIHQEVFVDNEVRKGLRAPLRAFKLQTEPWLFAVDAKGRITQRLEGSFGFDAMELAIKSALR
ncbi:MAG: hypothetical protein JWO90_2379 [Solirubrobacterales bacterium]|nr:hypothetical protein [Solirubrobacterales bacterium]